MTNDLENEAVKKAHNILRALNYDPSTAEDSEDDTKDREITDEVEDFCWEDSLQVLLRMLWQF